MRFRQLDHPNRLHSHVDEIATQPGVQVTRRAAIWFGTSGLMAILSGCSKAPTQPIANDDDDHDESDSSTHENESESSSAGDPSSTDDHETSTSDELDTTTSGDESSDPSETSNDENSTSATTEQSSADDQTNSDETNSDATDSDETSSGDSSPLTLQELMDLIHPDAESLIAEKDPDEIAFLEEVVKWMKRLHDQFSEHPTNNYDITPLLQNSPVEILQIDMAPGAKIPLHDHADYIGALVGIKGSADCINYTVTEGEVEPGYFLLQETSRTDLKAGVTSYLGLKLHNFHVVEAGSDGAQMIDVFVFFDPNGTSNWATIVGEVDASEKIYKAQWGGFVTHGDPRRVMAR